MKFTMCAYSQSLTCAFLDFFQASDEAIHCVHFFGSYDYGFVTAADIKLYGEHRATKGRVRGKPAVFANAVKEIEEALEAESNLPEVSLEEPGPYFVMENPNVPAIRYGHCNLKLIFFSLEIESNLLCESSFCFFPGTLEPQAENM